MRVDRQPTTFVDLPLPSAALLPSLNILNLLKLLADGDEALQLGLCVNTHSLAQVFAQTRLMVIRQRLCACFPG